jgi:hypothetical protein
MITYGSLRPLPAVVRAPGLRGSSEVYLLYKQEFLSSETRSGKVARVSKLSKR